MGYYDVGMASTPTDLRHSLTADVALVWAGTVSCGFQILRPGMVGAMIDDLALSPDRVGFICALQLTCSGIATIVLLAMGQVTARAILALGILGLGLADLAGAVCHSAMGLAVWQALGGLSSGAAFTVSTARASRSIRSGVLFAGFGAAQAAFGIAGYAALPWVLRAGGCASALALLGALALTALPGLAGLAPICAPAGPRSRLLPPRTQRTLLLSAAVAGMSYTGAGAYVERIGLRTGLSHTVVSVSLAISMIGCLSGALYALYAGARDRPGRLLSLGLRVLLLSLALLLLPTSAPVYCAALLGLAACPMLLVPAYLGSLNQIERDPGAPVRGLIAVSAGMAAGPAIAGELISAAGYPAFVATAVGSAVLAMLLAATAIGRRRQQLATPV